MNSTRSLKVRNLRQPTCRLAYPANPTHVRASVLLTRVLDTSVASDCLQQCGRSQAGRSNTGAVALTSLSAASQHPEGGLCVVVGQADVPKTDDPLSIVFVSSEVRMLTQVSPNPIAHPPGARILDKKTGTAVTPPQALPSYWWLFAHGIAALVEHNPTEKQSARF